MIRLPSAALAILLAAGPVRSEVYFRLPVGGVSPDGSQASTTAAAYPVLTRVTEGNAASVSPSSGASGARGASTYELTEVSPETGGITVPDGSTGLVRVSDRVPVGTYTIRVTRKDADGATRQSDPFGVQVLPVGRASLARPAAFAYPNDARYYGLHPAEAQALSGLYDRSGEAVVTIAADRSLDVLQYRFASVTRANRCHIEFAAPGEPDTILTFMVNGGRAYPFTVPLVSGHGVYDGECGLPSDYQTLQFTLTSLTSLEAGSSLQFNEFRLGLDGVDSP